VEQVLARTGLFRGVSECSRAAIVSRLQQVEFPRRHTVFAEGEPVDRLYIIIAGKVMIGRRAAGGRENLVSVIGPADIFGDVSILDGGPRTSTAETITEVRVAWMSRADLLAWIADDPQNAERLFTELARLVRLTNDQMSDLVFTDVAGRVAKLLLRLGQRFGKPEGHAVRVTHDLRQDELARLVGASRETVNKVLADFAARGWIQFDAKSVLICMPGRLARRAR
jgi:CRP-like cAMP-binding protein